MSVSNVSRTHGSHRATPPTRPNSLFGSCVGLYVASCSGTDRWYLVATIIIEYRNFLPTTVPSTGCMNQMNNSSKNPGIQEQAAPWEVCCGHLHDPARSSTILSLLSESLCSLLAEFQLDDCSAPAGGRRSIHDSPVTPASRSGAAVQRPRCIFSAGGAGAAR